MRAFARRQGKNKDQELREAGALNHFNNRHNAEEEGDQPSHIHVVHSEDVKTLRAHRTRENSTRTSLRRSISNARDRERERSSVRRERSGEDHGLVNSGVGYLAANIVRAHNDEVGQEDKPHAKNQPRSQYTDFLDQMRRVQTILGGEGDAGKDRQNASRRRKLEKKQRRPVMNMHYPRGSANISEVTGASVDGGDASPGQESQPASGGLPVFTKAPPSVNAKQMPTIDSFAVDASHSDLSDYTEITSALDRGCDGAEGAASEPQEQLAGQKRDGEEDKGGYDSSHSSNDGNADDGEGAEKRRAKRKSQKEILNMQNNYYKDLINDTISLSDKQMGWVDGAAVYVMDAINGRTCEHDLYDDEGNFDRVRAKHYNRYHSNSWRSIRSWVIFFHMLLVFFEHRGATINFDSPDARSSATETVYYMTPLPVFAMITLDLLFILFYAWECNMRYLAQGKNSFFASSLGTRNKTIIGLISVGVVDCLFAYLVEALDVGTGGSVRIVKFLRPIFFALYDPPTRVGGKLMVESAAQIWKILGLLTLHVTFYSTLGYILMSPDKIPGNTAFATLEDSFMSLVVLITTANFPDVMMVAYDHHR
jgi:hypothetical protein